MAEQYPANEPGKTTPPTRGGTERIVTREGAEGGAEVYREPRRGGFPWWLLLLGLIPLLLWAFNDRNRDRTPTTAGTPVAVATPAGVSASASPDPNAAGDTAAMAGGAAAGAGAMSGTGDDATSETGSAALPPTAAGTAGMSASGGAAPQGKDIKVYSGKDIAAAPKFAASKQGEPLSDVVTFAQMADKSALIDRKAKLTNVNVVEVLSPRALIVGPSTGQHMLVLLDNRLDAGTGNQKVSVAAGKPVSLVGILKAAPSADVMASQYGVSSDKVTAHTDDTVYLHATVAQEK